MRSRFSPTLTTTFVTTTVLLLLSFSVVSAAFKKKHRTRSDRAIPRNTAEAAAAAVEKQVLVDLYDATNGPSWINQWGWLNDSISYCDWEGVGCNNSTLVTSLKLPSNSLQGTVIDLRGLEQLTLLDLSRNELEGAMEDTGVDGLNVLKHINLAYNALVGTLLSQFPMSLVSLDVGQNQIDGTVPKIIGNLSLLQNLNLAGNSLSGQLPYIGSLTSLLSINVGENTGLTGSLNEIGISNLTNLTSLNLANNKFNGTLDSVANLTSLQDVDLSDNAFSGNLSKISNLTALTSLNLARNKLQGTLPNMTNLTLLQELDLGENLKMTGSIQGLANLTRLKVINLAHNRFNGTVDLRAIASLQVLDLSHNVFTGQVANFSNLTLIEGLDISSNELNGTIPGLQAMTALKFFNASRNSFTGSIPDITGAPVLRWLDLSHQLKTEVVNGDRLSQGLTGKIPDVIGQLFFLEQLHLNDNLLTGEIPEDISRLGFLRILNLENNQLSGSIPPNLNLLYQLETLILARNRLGGPIPELGGSETVIRTVKLEDNAELEAPAPFVLCDLDDLDIREDDSYCPLDRQALVAFYMGTKGADWNVDTNWLSDKHHCTWFGVTCDESNTTVLHLTLTRNGLQGSIPPQLFALSTFESIDFNDNSLYGPVPSEIGMLTDLAKLRLSYNLLTGIPTTFGMLTKLSFLHIHGNRIAGSDEYISVSNDGEQEHSFISDCGEPVDSLEPFECDGCDMCCNSLEECQVPVQQTLDNFNGWVSALIITAAVIALLLISGALVMYLVRRNKLSPSKASAREACGAESVYSFVLTSSYAGWVVAFGTILIQVAIFALFLNASQFDSEVSDWVYSWRCPRNNEECNDEREVDMSGWIVWALLVITSVLDDLASGIKLDILAASRRSVHSFVGSAILVSITVLAVWTSATYNRAIAMSNTELIVNAVILLFVNDIDEQIYNAVRVINPKWVNRMGEQADALSARLLEKDEKDDDNGDNDSESGVFYPTETWDKDQSMSKSRSYSI